MSKPSAPERIELAPGLVVSRLVTGLWQVADMERDGTRSIRTAPRPTSQPMRRRASTRSTWPTITAAPRTSPAASTTCSRQGRVQALPSTRPAIFTKWCPVPGADEPPMSFAPGSSARCARLQTKAIDLLQFHWWSFRASGLARRRCASLRGPQGRGADRPSRRHQFRHRPSAPPRKGRHTDRDQPGVLLAARPARRRGDVGLLCCRRRQASRLRDACRRPPYREMARPA